MPNEWAVLFEITKLAVGGLALFSIIIAFKAYKANVKKQEEDRLRDADKELLSQARLSLEWAYNALTDSDASIPPHANRLNWLTCARHLLRHEKLARRIQTETYRLVNAEHEEFWRHKFYLALNFPQLLHANYFTGATADASRSPIDVTSALVVVNFSNWPEDVRDPTDEVDRSALLSSGHGFQGLAGRGLRAYVAELDAQRQQRTPFEA